MEVKVGKVELRVTNNGTPKVNIYLEGSDFENIAESIEIIGEESIYAMTRKAGDVINIIEKGKWKNLEIPTDYMKLLNSYNSNLEKEVAAKTERIELLQDKLILGMSDMIESRDSNTGGHVKRSSLAIRIFMDELRKCLIEGKMISITGVAFWFIIGAICCIIGVHIIHKNENSYAKVI